MVPSLILISVLNGVYAFTGVVFALLCRGIIDSAINGNHRQLMWYGGTMFGAIAVALMIRIISGFVLMVTKGVGAVAAKPHYFFY